MINREDGENRSDMYKENERVKEILGDYGVGDQHQKLQEKKEKLKPKKTYLPLRRLFTFHPYRRCTFL